MSKTIIADFFTTVSFKQAVRSLFFLSFGLRSLRFGNNEPKVKKQIAGTLNMVNSKVLFFYSASTSIYQALQLIGIAPGDEVLVNSYTCVVVSNAVIQSGADIAYSDIEDKTLSFDYETLISNIQPKTKVIIIQHSFGMEPFFYRRIIALAKEKGIIIIDDCAQSLGNHSRLLGDFSIFSTGRDKVISSVSGGILLINNKKYFKNSQNIELQYPSITLTIKNHFYNLFGYISFKLYNWLSCGKIIIYLIRRFKFIPEVVTLEQKECRAPLLNYALPNSLVQLMTQQINNIKIYTDQRTKNAIYYRQHLQNKNIKILSAEHSKNNFFRVVAICKSEDYKNRITKYMKANNVLLGVSWTGSNIAPKGTQLRHAHYTKGSCRNAEILSKKLIFLPNGIHITTSDKKKVVDLINKFK